MRGDWCVTKVLQLLSILPVYYFRCPWFWKSRLVKCDRIYPTYCCLCHFGCGSLFWKKIIWFALHFIFAKMEAITNMYIALPKIDMACQNASLLGVACWVVPHLKVRPKTNSCSNQLKKTQRNTVSQQHICVGFAGRERINNYHKHAVHITRR